MVAIRQHSNLPSSPQTLWSPKSKQQCPPTTAHPLGPGEEEVFALRRVESRMREMLTEEYLRLQHLCFTTQDVRVSLLLTGETA